MLNEQFWNKGEGNECPDKISEFIKNFPICRNFNDVQKKQLEEGIYDLIYFVKEPVFRAAEREYFREDVTMKIKEFFDEKGETILNSLPVSELDVVVDKWQDDLSDCDVYWDANWAALDNILDDVVWLSDIMKYEYSDVRLYGAYLKDWYANHHEGEPVCINEFFACEMKDANLQEYYKNLLAGNT